MTASDWPSLEDRLRALAGVYAARLEDDPHEVMPLGEVVQDLALLLQGAAPDVVPERAVLSGPRERGPLMRSARELREGSQVPRA